MCNRNSISALAWAAAMLFLAAGAATGLVETGTARVMLPLMPVLAMLTLKPIAPIRPCGERT